MPRVPFRSDSNEILAKPLLLRGPRSPPKQTVRVPSALENGADP